MTKKLKVIYLPINEFKELQFVNGIIYGLAHQPQRLYLIDPLATISVGDWYIEYLYSNHLVQCTPDFNFKVLANQVKRKEIAKIITTSNKELQLPTIDPIDIEYIVNNNLQEVYIELIPKYRAKAGNDCDYTPVPKLHNNNVVIVKQEKHYKLEGGQLNIKNGIASVTPIKVVETSIDNKQSIEKVARDFALKQYPTKYIGNKRIAYELGFLNAIKYLQNEK